MKLNIKNKNGFSILAIILVIVAVIVAIGVWALSGSSNTSSSGNSTSKIVASSLINDSASIKLAYDTLVINGASPDNIVFNPGATGSSNVLDPVNGIQLPNGKNGLKDGATEPNGVWTYNKSVNVVGVGSTQNDYAIVIAGLKDSVCKSVNNTLYASETIPVFGPMNGSEGFVTGSTSGNPNSTVALDFQNGGLSVLANGWTAGCIASNSNPDNNMFFRVLQIR